MNFVLPQPLLFGTGGKIVQNGQTEPNANILFGIWVPEGVFLYVERRSLFVV